MLQALAPFLSPKRAHARGIVETRGVRGVGHTRMPVGTQGGRSSGDSRAET